MGLEQRALGRYTFHRTYFLFCFILAQSGKILVLFYCKWANRFRRYGA